MDMGCRGLIIYRLGATDQQTDVNENKQAAQ